MTIVDDRTPSRSWPKPNEANNLADDVLRLKAALDAADGDVAVILLALAGKAALSHGHTMSEISGLIQALSGKAGTDHQHALGDLTDVNVAGATNGQFLKRIGSGWQPAVPAIADVNGLQSALNGKVALKDNSIAVPRGNSDARPTAGSGDALVRYNTEIAAFEGWNGERWGKIAGGAPTTATPPIPAVDGDLWWHPQYGLLIYYDDGDSKQWVSATASADPALLLLRANNGSDIESKSAFLMNLGVSTLMQTLLGCATGADAFAALGATKSFGTSGYQKLPSGLILQWGVLAAGQDPMTPLPVTFPNAGLVAVATNRAAGFAPTDAVIASVYALSTTQIGVAQRFASNGGIVGSNPYPCNWIAIGH